MSSIPRKHHYVQAEHLRQFVDDTGLLWVYSKDGKQFHGTPEGLFKQKDLNSFEGDQGLDTSFEEFCSKIERECWPALKQCLVDERIDASNLERLTFYLAHSRMRNPSFQNGIIGHYKQMLETTAKLMDANGDFDSDPNPLDPTKSLTDLLEEGTIEFEVNNYKYLEVMAEQTRHFAGTLLRGFRWCLVHSPHNRVIISDHPLTYVHPAENPGAYGIPPGGKSCEMAFPLSKSTYLVGLWERQIEDFESEDVVDELNKRQAIFANRHVASCHRKRWVGSLTARFKSFGFQTVNDRIGPLNGGYQIMRMGVYPLNKSAVIARHPLEATTSIANLHRLVSRA